uniref:Uncharacterized protein n=1 Tax=viral metagenome TaxID=1070528 RepID=A0A6C0BF93_9ZZZZ
MLKKDDCVKVLPDGDEETPDRIDEQDWLFIY